MMLQLINSPIRLIILFIVALGLTVFWGLSVADAEPRPQNTAGCVTYSQNYRVCLVEINGVRCAVNTEGGIDCDWTIQN